MKKINKKILYVLLAIFSISISFEVKADEIETSSIENSTYIIGTHLLSRTGSNAYNGVLTTKVIMLSSKTIKEGTLDEMVIYYKTARGVWVDGITGEAIEVPDKFEITYNNLLYNGQYGDLNGDGKVDIKDIEYLEKYIAGEEIPSEISSNIMKADVNADGDIDAVDLNILKKFVRGELEHDLPYTEYETYTITYDLGDATATNPTKYSVYNDDIVLTEPTKPAKEIDNRSVGYYFLGWTGSNGEKPQKEVVIKAGTHQNLTYKANFVLYGDLDEDGNITLKDVVRLRRYIAGGFDLPQSVYDNIMAADVNQDGVINDIDVAFLRVFLTRWLINLPCTDYEKYDITYELDGGVVDGENPVMNTEYGINNPTLINPTKEGYVFIGWTGSNGNVPQTNVYIPASDGDLHYVANYVLYGDLNDDGSVNGLDVVRFRKYLSGVEDIGQESLARIKAMDLNSDGLVNNNDLVILRAYLMGTITKLPSTDYVKYTISYELNGGTDVDNPTYMLSIDDETKTLINPTKDGYTFVGWTGSNGDTPELNVQIPARPTENLHYVANFVQDFVITATPVDAYSPDVVLSLSDASADIERIEYTDGAKLCDNTNMTVAKVDIEGVSKLIVVLKNGQRINATIAR